MELDAKVGQQVTLHLESAAAAYEEARRGFETSLGEVARTARGEAEAVRVAITEEVGRLHPKPDFTDPHPHPKWRCGG